MIKKIRFKVDRYYRQNKEFILLFALPFSTVVGITLSVVILGAIAG